MPIKRLNITLPEQVFNSLKALVKTGQTSSFISRLIEEKLKEKQKEKIMLEIAEGYKIRRKEDKLFSDKFNHLDSEGLDDY